MGDRRGEDPPDTCIQDYCTRRFASVVYRVFGIIINSGKTEEQ